jgi:hypothetical protein
VTVLFPPNIRGLPLTRETAPELIDLIEKTAAAVGTDMPARIMLTPDGSIHVQGMRTRTLTIGMASLRHLTTEQFKAILAHEFAHFSHDDTSISAIVGQIGNVMERQRKDIGKHGLSGPVLLVLLNFITYIILSVTIYIYLAVYSVFSRRREYLADAIAARTTSPETFSGALVTFATYTSLFESVMPRIVVDELVKGKILVNVYETNNSFWSDGQRAQTVEGVRADLLKAEAEDFSTHPSISDRIARVGGRHDGAVHGGLAVNLLKNRDEREKEMSQFLTFELGIKTGLIKVSPEGKVEFLKPAA